MTNPIRALAAPLLVAAVQAVYAPAAAQTTAPVRRDPAFDLSVRNIMRGEGLVGRSPDEVRWSEDSRTVYFRWRDPESRDTATHVYRVRAAGGAPEMVPDSMAYRVAPAQQGDWNPERTRRASERGGDVFVVDATGRERRITDTPQRERSPHLSADGRTVYFLSGNNVFAMEVDGGVLRQITDLRMEAAPARDTARGQRRFLENQQRELLDAVRDRREERLHRARLDSLRASVPPVYLGKDVTLQGAEVSPSGRYLLLTTNARVDGQKTTIVPNYITESGFTEDIASRTKVGDAQAGGRVGILELATGKVSWVEAEKERRPSIAALGWAPRADRALLMSVPENFKDRWIYVATPDARTTLIEHLHNDAWVGGPAFFSGGWTGDDRVWFISEKTGYSHLYTAPATGGAITALTQGDWEVTEVQPSADGRRFHITTSETHPGERNLYAVSIDGGPRTRLTTLAGWTEARVSPDGRWAALLHSAADAPAELYLMPVGRGAAPRRVTTSTTAEFRRGPWIKPQVVTFKAQDGATVYARIYRPRDLGAASNGAGVLFVHGAGYLQNAHRGWSTYYREYMFNHLLASRGYTVMDVDYRGSAGYGGAWRTGIYRHMGGKDLSDHVDAARWMVANEGVDAKRVGLYGGSYGGFITLMGLFTEPDVFRSGAALRSVTDWAHYNHPYTARILNQPQDDTLAYRRSSPIYFAEGLRGDLLMAHGMVDTNVHFQDIVRLSQRLIELGKTNWELAVYPVEDHAFTRPESWADEYRRIYELFERTLR
jgi:dipeptidyl aminopeptidase/acylaminoacyl peptidase